MSDELAIRLRGVVKRYGATAAVSGISFTVESGTLVTLLGPSGCGKTTTLRMIAGLEEPSGGSIRIGERMVYDRARAVFVLYGGMAPLGESGTLGRVWTYDGLTWTEVTPAPPAVQPEPRRRAVVVLTDGSDNASRLDPARRSRWPAGRVLYRSSPSRIAGPSRQAR